MRRNGDKAPSETMGLHGEDKRAVKLRATRWVPDENADVEERRSSGKLISSESTPLQHAGGRQ